MLREVNMKISGNYDVHTYGIQGFKNSSVSLTADMNRVRYTPLYEELKSGYSSKHDENLISMVYGNGETFEFNKNRAYELILTILGEENLVERMGITKSIFEKFCEMNGVENVLNDTLKGLGVVIVTHKNASNVLGLTRVDKDGNLVAKQTTDLFLTEYLFNKSKESKSDFEL